MITSDGRIVVSTQEVPSTLMENTFTYDLTSWNLTDPFYISLSIFGPIAPFSLLYCSLLENPFRFSFLKVSSSLIFHLGHVCSLFH